MKHDPTAANEKITMTLTSDVPFHFKAHHVHASVSSHVDLFVVTTTLDIPSQPDSTERVPQNARMKVIIALYVHTSLHNSHPSLPPPQIT